MDQIGPNVSKCQSDSGKHLFLSDGVKVVCAKCGEPLEHSHKLERDIDFSDAHKEVFTCTHLHCEYSEEESNDCQP